MSNNPLMLTGRVQPDEVSALQRKIQRLEDEVTELKDALLEARQQGAASNRARARLQQALQPFADAINGIFEDLKDVSVSEAVASVRPKTAAVWESWKTKLGGKQAEFIQALLEHGQLTAVQLKVATHTGTSTVPQVIYKLNALGLINKNGGKYSLKEI